MRISGSLKILKVKPVKRFAIQLKPSACWIIAAQAGASVCSKNLERTNFTDGERIWWWWIHVNYIQYIVWQWPIKLLISSNHSFSQDAAGVVMAFAFFEAARTSFFLHKYHDYSNEVVDVRQRPSIYGKDGFALFSLGPAFLFAARLF